MGTRTQSAGSVILAISVVILMVLATFAVVGSLPRPSPTVGSSALAPSSAATPSIGAVVQGSSGSTVTAGSCAQEGSQTASSSSSLSGAKLEPKPATTGPGPLFNSQVTPYAKLTGPYAYVARGAALRDQGYGYVNLTWPSGTLVAAYMIWAILNNTVPPTNASVNGHALNGTWTAYATPSPCWSPAYIYTFAADVTSYVVNGSNHLTGFPSGITSGVNPWANPTGTQNNLCDEGASLVFVYEPNPATTIHQVTVYTGALPVTGAGPIATLNYSKTNSTKATTTFIVADGQFSGNPVAWNGTQIDSNAFPGSDPKTTTIPWSDGNLSDTKTYQVNVTSGSVNTTAEVSTNGNDCVTWVGQVLSVGVPAQRGPYSVNFTEQGLPGGTLWNITTHSTTKTNTSVGNTGSVLFSLANGTYSYSVGSLSGYIATNAGSYQVRGGPVFIRVIFHQLVYSLTFNETGLPTGAEWWVDLTNKSESIASNLSAYAPAGFNYLEPNATYNYSTGEIGLWIAKPPATHVQISGLAVKVTISFAAPPLFNVTFVEKHLLPGTTWGGRVDANWGDFSNSTANRSFSLMLPNTTSYEDTFYANPVTGYLAPNYIDFPVSGKSEIINVSYQQEYPYSSLNRALRRQPSGAATSPIRAHSTRPRPTPTTPISTSPRSTVPIPLPSTQCTRTQPRRRPARSQLRARI